MTRQTTDHFLSLSLIFVMCFAVFSTYSVNAESVDRSDENVREVSRGFGPHRLFKLLHHLDISREQRTAIGEVMDQHRPVMREFMFDMMDGKKALHGILTSPDYDPKQIEELAMLQAKNAEEMFLATAKTFAEISAILTPEQRQELAKMIEEHGEHRRRGPRRDRGPM